MSNSIIIRECTDRATWERFVLSLHPDTFLHSWNWKEMQERLGETTVPLGAYRGEDLLGVALGVTVTARRGAFLFCPHGPLVAGGLDKEMIFDQLLDALVSAARSRNLAFIRVSPLVQENDPLTALFPKHRFRSAPIHMHAERMWILDIRPSEEELLKGMRKTTRNLIRRAERDGVHVRMSTDASDIDTFAALYRETAQREQFIPFSREFLVAEFETFVPEKRIFFAFAEHHGRPLAGALIPQYGDVGFYHQGASSRMSPKIPAAYLLHWEIIRALKREGCVSYNFWGIAPEDPSHPWAGLSQFKQGFGGHATSYLHAQDLPLTPQYWLTYGIETFRRWRRHL